MLHTLVHTSVRKLGYWFHGSEFESRQDQGIFTFSKKFLVSVQWVPSFQPGREVDHSSPVSAEVNNGYSSTSASSVRTDATHRDNRAFYLYVLLLTYLLHGAESFLRS